MKYVRKRDGRLEPFDQNRITEAIWKAAKAVGGRDRRVAEALSSKVVELLRKRFGEDGVPTVEEIQDAVEKVLIENGHARTAKAYILYRRQHQELREMAQLLGQVELVESYIDMEDWRVRENANMTYSLQGLNNYLAGTVVANYWLNKLYPPEVAEAHKEGDIHIHNLSMLAAYCLPPETIIAGDYKPIAEHKPGDNCLGAAGKVTIERVYEREYVGKIVRIKARGILPIELTPEHPVLVSDKKGNMSWKMAEHLRQGDYLVMPVIEGFIEDTSIDLMPFALRPRSVKSKVFPITEETAWILGLYVAEGSVSGEQAVFCLGPHEAELAQKVQSILKRAGFSSYVARLKTGLHVRLTSYVLTRALKKWCGGLQRTRRIPWFILYHKDSAILHSFLDGYVAGDGTKQTARKNVGPRIRMATASKVLALQLQMLCARLGHFASIVEVNTRDSTIEGRLIRGNKIFEVSFPTKGSQYVRKYQGFFLTPIRDVQLFDYAGKVFNLETTDHTYLANNVVVHNCVGWDMLDLLLTGFRGAPGKVASKPAKHLRTALLQMVNYVFTLQNETAGAQAFSYVDVYLAPFIRKDGLDQRAVDQAVQEFVFNMNVPTRVGGQTPFSNVTLGGGVPEFMKDAPVVVDGKVGQGTYGDYEEEVAMFNKAFAKVMCEGDAEGRVFTFPIPTYNVTGDFRWEGEVAQGIFEMSAKYGIPYFANFVNSDMRPEDVRSMCCRLRLDTKELRRRGGGLFGADPLTGSIGVVTINLPRIGYLAKDEDEFFERLDRLMEIAKTSLEIKRKVLERFTENGLYPYCRFYLRNVKAARRSYWANHFSTIGLIGMNEALLNMFGYGIANPEGRKFAVKVLKHMRERLVEFQEETGNMYNLEATPAEGTSYRLARIDKKKYPDIIVANEEHVKRGAAPFYTNSTQLPVDCEMDLFEALESQDELQTLYTGGTVFHIWLGERLSSWRAAADLVKRVFSAFRMPYITLTPTFSVCPSHGYLSGEHRQCPQCGSKCEVYSRVVGYLRPVDQWNEGKQAEFAIRRTFEKSAVVRA